jgi:hypothetical protein
MPAELRNAVHHLVAEAAMNLQDVLRYTKPGMGVAGKRMMYPAPDAADTLDMGARPIAAYLEATGDNAEPVVHALAVAAQLGSDPGPAVGAVPLGVHGPDPLGESDVGLLTVRRGPRGRPATCRSWSGRPPARHTTASRPQARWWSSMNWKQLVTSSSLVRKLRRLAENVPFGGSLCISLRAAASSRHRASLPAGSSSAPGGVFEPHGCIRVRAGRTSA